MPPTLTPWWHECIHVTAERALVAWSQLPATPRRGQHLRRFVQAFSSRDVLPATMPEALAVALLALPDRYNISGRTPAAVVFRDVSQKRAALHVGEFIWGLVPKWSKEPQTRYTTVTARLQRAPRSRIFRGPWETQRCVVPMNGYYKWDRSSKPAAPYFIQAQDGRALFAAGLWELWEKGDAPLATFSILTHPNAAIPAPLVADGPVFLPHAEWSRWVTDPLWFPMRYLTTMKQPPLEAYRVSRAIRDATRDDYTLLEPASEDQLGDGDGDELDEWDDDDETSAS